MLLLPNVIIAKRYYRRMLLLPMSLLPNVIIANVIIAER
jgi:hypothetical protein